jgi:hypothetical protein
MTDNPRLKLHNAEEKLKRATREAERVVRVITDAGEKLRNWQNVRVSDIKIPIEGLGSSAPSINAKKWPTARQLTKVLAAWHKADKAVLDAEFNVKQKRGQA